MMTKPDSSRQPKEESTVFWWTGWILLTIVSFFVSCIFWTRIIATHVGNMHRPGVPILWVATVFGSWMVLLVPLIIVMYNKVDKAYEDTRMARETAQFSRTRSELGPRSVSVETSKRVLPKELTERLKRLPETIRGGHLVTVSLRDGRKIENVFVANKKEILGIYNTEEMSFSADDISDLLLADLDKLPLFEAQKWLKLDGIDV